MLQFQIQHYPELASTNTLAAELAGKGASEGLVIVADYQSNGRGRAGKTWLSPPGKNLLFSILLKPARLPAHRAPFLTQIACRTIAKVLKNRYDILSAFKRPNDVFVNERKICGILTEARTDSKGRVEFAVVGVGLNVNAESKDLPAGAVSMKELRKGEIVKDVLLKEILCQFSLDMQSFYDHTV